MRIRVWLALFAVVAVVAAGVLLLGKGGGGRPSVEVIDGGGSAGAFVGSIGVGVHLNYLDTAYGRQSGVLARLKELGVRHIRDGVPFHTPVLDRGLRAAARRGLHATLLTDLRILPGDGVRGGVQAMGPRVDAFEAPNELDATGPPDWRQRLPAYLRLLRGGMRAHRARVPLLGPSFVDPTVYRSIAGSSYDVANLHPYPGGLPPEEALREQLRRSADAIRGHPIVFTETGYQNALASTVGQPPVSEVAAAAYLPRALLWAFAAGVKRTFVYELLDEKPDPGLVDPERHFGLLRNDLSRKPAFDAVRNLIRSVARSPGAASRTPPSPTVRAAEPIDRVALTRADGSRVLALWRPVSLWDVHGRRAIDPGRARVSVSWPAAAENLTVTRPSVGAAPVATLKSTYRLELVLGGGVVLLSYR